VQVLRLNTPYVVGGRLLWETPLDGLRVGGSVQALRLDTDLLAGTKVASAEIPAVLAVGSIEYAAHDVAIAAEYSRWFVKVNSSDSNVIPASPVVTSERGYFMMSYRATKRLQPGAYYSVLFSDVDHRDGRDHFQHDVASTLRFDITSNWLLKLEAHYMNGTATLTPQLNGNLPLSVLSKSWTAFFAKTTAYF
jgi:hypothetical protein